MPTTTTTTTMEHQQPQPDDAQQQQEAQQRIPYAQWPDDAPSKYEDKILTIVVGHSRLHWALHEGSQEGFFPIIFWKYVCFGLTMFFLAVDGFDFVVAPRPTMKGVQIAQHQHRHLVR